MSTKGDLPFVSVVIPAYNEQNYIKNTLESLKKQNYPRDKYEVIVVNNASQDQTAEIAKKAGAKVVSEPRKGVQHARQTGFEAAKGEFIASTDADDYLPPDWLSKMTQKLIDNPSLAAIGGWIRHDEGSWLSRFIVNNLSGPFIKFYEKASFKPFLNAQNFIVRKSAFTKTDGFKNVPAFCEDLNLAKRLKKYGKVKLDISKELAVVASPRRWHKGFFLGMRSYVLNGISWALFAKVIVKNLEIARPEN